MKKLFFGTLLLALVIVVPISTMAGVDINISIPLPPPIVFAAPPELIVLPETDASLVPDVDVDIFFFDGWWWRPWEGRWYRSQYYNSGWGYYRSVPSFYVGIPLGWRNDYRNHRWGGHQWNHKRIPHQEVQRNWRGWKNSRHWEKQQTWGVQGLQPRTRSQQPSRKVQQRQSRPQSRDVNPGRSQPQQQKAGPQSRGAAKPQQQVAGPQSGKGQPQHSQQQQGKQGNHKKGKVGKQDRK